jgi:hypothetical protein
MTLAGLLIMVFSVALVTVLFVWCVYKVITSPEASAEHLHGFEQETPDVEH